MEPEEAQDREPEFDAFADEYDEALEQGLKLSGESKDFFAEGRILWMKRRFSELSFSPSSILDFGCGTGSATPFFFGHFDADALLGVDPSEKSLRQAREKWARFPARFAPSCEDSGAFDLAFCNGVFHHIPPSDRAEAANTVFRSLRSGGLFAFWENNPWNPVTRYAMTRVSFDRDAVLVWPGEARRLLRTSGFEILRTDYQFFFPKFLAGLRAIEPSLCRIPLGGQYLVLCRKPS